MASSSPKKKLHLGSTSAIKIPPLKFMGYDVVPHRVDSGVSEQPMSYAEIKQGVINRLKAVSGGTRLNCVAIESGHVNGYEVNMIGVTTRAGILTHHTEFPVPSHLTREWDGTGTLGQHLVKIGRVNDDKDWYHAATQESRVNVIAKLCQDFLPRVDRFIHDIPKFPLKGHNFREVDFLDVGDAFSQKTQNLVDGLYAVTRHLNFEYVVGMEMRGIPLAIGLAARLSGAKMVMARKDGKLHGELFSTGKITKAYKDTKTDLFVQRFRLPKGATVLIVDDIAESCGSVRAVAEALRREGYNVVGAACSYVIPDSEGNLKGDPGCDLYFANLHGEVPTTYPVTVGEDGPLYLSDPETSAILRYQGKNVVDILWKEFDHGTKELNFPVDLISGRELRFVVDTRSPYTRSLVEFASICSAYDCTSRVYALYCDELTQDRIFHTTVDGVKYESLASGSTTIHRLFGDVNLTLVTPHNVVNRLSRKDVRVVDMMPVLMETFFKDHPNVRPVFPDDGAHKRFGSHIKGLTDRKALICYKRRIGDTDKREITIVDRLNEGDDYVIGDDLVRSGGTLLEVLRYLKAHGARRVYCMLVHMSGSAKSIPRLAEFDGGITTNTTFGRCPEGWTVIDVLNHI